MQINKNTSYKKQKIYSSIAYKKTKNLKGMWCNVGLKTEKEVKAEPFTIFY